MSEPAPLPLSGFTVAITANRRADELTTLLERRGATVIGTAAMRLIPLADDDTLRLRTQDLIENPPTMTIATTGLGFRGWIEGAEGWGLAQPLLDVLTKSQIISRGPKPTGALRAAGLREVWSPKSESSAEVLEYLLEQGVQGERVALQLHGATDEWDPNPGFVSGLQAAGAEVVQVPVYRWELPTPTDELDELIATVSRQECDALTFTSAPAVIATLQRARSIGLLDSYVAALKGPTIAMSVGPVTSAPLKEFGIDTSEPARMRLGALVRHIADELPTRALGVDVGNHHLLIKARSAEVDSQLVTVTTSGIKVLRLLAAKPGSVVSREEILDALPGAGTDTHAVEACISRLRMSLGDRSLIKTVVKRGYRLNTGIAN